MLVADVYCCLHVMFVLLLILFLLAQEVIKIMSGIHDEHVFFLLCVSKMDW